jgi:hypothetical protein
MNRRASIAGLILLIAFANAHGAGTGDPAASNARADAAAEKITSAEKFLAELSQTVELARDGQYGPINRADRKRLLEAEATIVALLEGQTDARHLQPDQRIALYNAQEEITAIVRADDKDRKVCRRVANTGTRLAKAECLTVAEREARAKEARDYATRAQRVVCYVGEGSPC